LVFQPTNRKKPNAERKVKRKANIHKNAGEFKGKVLNSQIKQQDISQSVGGKANCCLCGGVSVNFPFSDPATRVENA